MTATIADITVLQDGAPTEQGIRLMELVHEASGMGCWHKFVPNVCWYDFLCCDKCDMTSPDEKDVLQTGDFAEPNPAYLTSLDAYRDVWEHLEIEDGKFRYKWTDYEEFLLMLASDTKRGVISFITIKPQHHLEALARVLEVSCSNCEGVWGRMENRINLERCFTCKGKGRMTVLDKWVSE